MSKSIFYLLLILLNWPAFLMAQQRPGDISVDAVYIDADELMPFHEGFAIIRKGIASAIIDKNGSFLIPYQRDFIIGITKSRFGAGDFADTSTATGPDGFVNGFCTFYDKVRNKHGFYNRKGKLTYTDYKIYTNFNKDGYAFIWGGNYIDTFGKKVQPKIKLPKKETGLSELTPVRKEDFFGKQKWGFKDARGNIIIPATYDEKPGNFSSGLALIWLVDKENKSTYSYIDQTGAARIKVTKGYPAQWPSNDGVLPGEPGTFVKGLSFWKTGAGFDDEKAFWVDTTGEVFSYQQLLDRFSAKLSLTNVVLDNIYGDYICFKGNLKQGERTYSGYAIINMLTNEALEGPFADIKFDDFAGLAFQKRTLYTNPTKPTTIEGYINTKGIFTIVKKE
jgi:hypothetical protein